MFADGGGLARPLGGSKRGLEGGRYPQYHRPRPYQPNPPNKNITTTMIKSVFVSIVVLSVNFRGVPCDRFRTSSTLEKDIAAVLAVHQDRKILYPPAIGAPIWSAYPSSRPHCAEADVDPRPSPRCRSPEDACTVKALAGRDTSVGSGPKRGCE